uniref:Pol polyprotein n=2 Tax=Cajanus cajan TaxID=3821 RepID=A0A151SSD7_CAJCA|nr:Pol polyprotein [Cajanus cajan]
MNILGPFPLAKRQCKFLLVAIDYFTKWIEAEPLATITANMVQKFMWRNIITRFDIPHAIITDNGLQFIDQKLNKFMEDLGIRH